jgi:hypothetical protein
MHLVNHGYISTEIKMHTKFHRNNLRKVILHHAIQSVIVYQKAKQCEALKQQRLAECVYNIADWFL